MKFIGPYFLVGCLSIALSACAFDVIAIRQVPTSFEATTDQAEPWTLNQLVTVHLEEGYASPLKQGTRWRQIGRITEGDVFRSNDQIVTVTASNQFQADIVLSGNTIVGFYLPVEMTFVAADPPIQINDGAS